MKRGLSAVVAALCLAGAVACLWAVWAACADQLGYSQHDRDAVRYLLGLDPSGGGLNMNVMTYASRRAGDMAATAVAAALAALLARAAWVLARRVRLKPGRVAGAPEPPALAWVRGGAAAVLGLAGCLLGVLSFFYCSALYMSDELQGYFDADDADFVTAVAVLSLVGLLGAAWLLPRRSRFLVPVLVLALLVGRQAAGASGAYRECLSLRGVLHGTQWVLRAD